MAECSDQPRKVDILPVALGEYLRELEDVDWYILGTHLGLKQSELREIQVDHQNNTGRMRLAMLDKWFSKEENPSWEKIIAALEEMHETSLARRLNSKYLHKKYLTDSLALETEGQQTTPETELKVHRNDRVSRELDSLKENYLRLKISAETALEKAKPSPRQLRRFSQEYLTNQVLETVKELFDCIGEFCFLDYALLENTISFFLKEAQTIVSDLSDYIQKLTQFKSSTTLREFMDNIEKAHKSIATKEGTRFGTVTLRLVGGWLEKTMQDLDKLLKEVFQDKKSILAHLRITRGSVLITYLAPQSEVDALIENAQLKHSFMPQVGVCGLRIGLTPAIIDKTETEVMHFSFESSLISAVKNDDIDVVTFLLDIDTNPDATDDEGQTALMVGSASGRDKAVSLLLNAKADPNFQRHDGVTPLYKAAQKGHSDVVSILLRASANINILTNDGNTPLHIARKNGHADVVSTLQISEGATAKPKTETYPSLTVKLDEDNYFQHPVTKPQIVTFKKPGSGRTSPLASAVSKLLQHPVTKPQIVIFGKPGSGRTSLASAIAGIDTDNINSTSEWDSGIKSTTEGVSHFDKGNVNILDTMGSMTKHTCDILNDLVKHERLQLIIVCIDMFEKLDWSTLEPLSLLHCQCYGVWSRTVIALTKADRYEEHKWLSKSLKNKFAEELTKRKDTLKRIFTNQALPCCYIGMTEEYFDRLNIPIIPTSELNKHALDRMEKVGYGYWFDTLLVECCQRADHGLRLHRDRLSQLPSGLPKRSRFDFIPNLLRWQLYCTKVITMPRFETLHEDFYT